MALNSGAVDVAALVAAEVPRPELRLVQAAFSVGHWSPESAKALVMWYGPGHADAICELPCSFNILVAAFEAWPERRASLIRKIYALRPMTWFLCGLATVELLFKATAEARLATPRKMLWAAMHYDRPALVQTVLQTITTAQDTNTHCFLKACARPPAAAVDSLSLAVCGQGLDVKVLARGCDIACIQKNNVALDVASELAAEHKFELLRRHAKHCTRGEACRLQSSWD